MVDASDTDLELVGSGYSGGSESEGSAYEYESDDYDSDDGDVVPAAKKRRVV